MRRYDSVIASRIPVLKLSEGYQNRALPASVDNSALVFFPGIYEQKYFTCQQYAGVSYTYAYERNRMLGTNAALPENRFPAHYSWKFMNNADGYTGVSFFYSFQLLKEQGHLTQDDYGHDTAKAITGWLTGYEKYLRGMKNRISEVHAVPTNTAEGVNTLKHYLNDHLDGSSSGGIACFSASSNFQATNVKTLPDGTPEAGKEVIIGFYPIATHGMTIVGYNDSIRYDLNGDGKFTNDIDINGDGKVDVKDWEIGAWRLANSYGTSWHDKGFSYILYRAMALDYDYPGGNWVSDRGIWNHSVYVVRPDTGYKPLLTMKVTLTYNSRNRIRILAGVSSDTSKLYPEHTMDFPLLSWQGGDHYMRGDDDSEESKKMEAGFDITPLLSHIRPGTPARFFMILEERDTLHTGIGLVNQCSFIDQSGEQNGFQSPATDIPVEDNSVTILSAVGAVNFSRPEIITGMLPVFKQGEAYQVQLEASGGKPPLSWFLKREYLKEEVDSAFIPVDQLKIAQEATYLPYKAFALPFTFPFCGTIYDTIWINFYGFISFDREQLPYPYITDEASMMKRKRIIAPAFCMNSKYGNNSYGIWVESLPSRVTVRWETGDPYIADLRIRSELRIYPSGEFEFLYGDILNAPGGYPFYTGYSSGDELNYHIESNYNPSALKNRSFRFTRLPLPEGLALTKEGLLSATTPAASKIFEIPVMVMDANHIISCKTFDLSDGPALIQQLICDEDSLLKFASAAQLYLKLCNLSGSPFSDITLKLSSQDTCLLISDSIESVPAIDPGSFSVIDQAFEFSLKHPLRDQSVVKLRLTVSSGERNWEKVLICRVHAPDIKIPSVVVHDGYNGYLEPGEAAFLKLKISNSGSLYCHNLSVVLSSPDTMVNIISQPEILVDRIDAFENIEKEFLVSASRNAPKGYKASMLLSLSDQKSVNIQVPVALELGKVPVALVSFSSEPTSVNAMKTALDSLRVPYSGFTSLPLQMDAFSCIFITCGTSTGGHMLTQEESGMVSDYLNVGGNLYLEISPAWFFYYKEKTLLNPMLMYESEKVPFYYYNSISGVRGTLTEGMYFDYLHSKNNSIFDFRPRPPAGQIFVNHDSLTFDFQIAALQGNYRTIASMIEFGWLSDGEEPSTRQTLMRRYLDFFDIEKAGPKVFFHSDRNQICRWDTVHFTDDSFDGVMTWHWEFPGGNPSSSPDPDPSVLYVDPGKYDVKLTVSDGVFTKQIVKKDFIDVQLCTGIPVQEPRPVMSVYPNPADDLLHVSFTGQFLHNALIEIYDMTGRKIIEKRIHSDNPVNDCEIDISSLYRGFYILILKTDSMKASAKIIVN